MNLKEIQKILRMDELPDSVKEKRILESISKDKNAIEEVLTMLSFERRRNKELLVDMNLCLSKSHVALTTPELNKDGFVQKEVIQFYEKNKNSINPCFNLQKE